MTARRTLGLGLALVVAIASTSALAQDGGNEPPPIEERSEGPDVLEMITPDLDLFGVTNLDGPGQDAFSPGLGGGAHIELTLFKSFGVHAGALLFVLIPDERDSVFFFGSQAGIRFHYTAFIEGFAGDGWVDVHHVFGRSGSISRHGLDGGAGYEFPLGTRFALGPYVRFMWLSDPGESAPMLLFAGVSGNLMARTRLSESVPDADVDGVPDDEDICPDIPQGGHGDPDNVGCPARDRDDDGLLDPEDACPSESMWPYPDHENEGCPLPDSDNDGVPDAHDVCPDEFAPDGGDPLREGCIEGEAGY